MRVEYELDQWEWQGTTQSIEIDPDDYKGMTEEEIKREVYAEIWRDAEQNLHFVYQEDEIVREILGQTPSDGDEDGD